jgi:DNA-binding GntR family transcriptional regulator
MTDNLTLKMDTYLPLRDVVFNTLREAILRGDLKPGERLMELPLASKLGVSRTPIREAIRMLEQEGLAVTVPRRGAEVARMTLKDMEDVLEIREALDELAVRLAIDKISPEQLERLREVRKEFERNTKSGDVKKIAESDVQFHDIIYEATDNPKLVGMLSNFRAQAYRYRVEYLKNPDAYPVLIREHEAIVESIETKDEKKAMQAMHEHVANQALAVKAVIEQQDNP